MKCSLFTLLIFVSLGFKSFADCAGTGLYMFPNSGEIKKTGIFVLNGYAESQNVIHGLNSKFPVYLQSGKEKIGLQVLEIQIGLFYLTQAVLKPEKPLTAGKEYELVIDHLPEYEKLGSYNSKTHQYDPITYFVKDESDTEAPQWIKIPEEKDKSLVHLGCGPSIYVNFNLKVRDESDFLIKTTVKSVETGKETTYYLSEGAEGLSVGHGMCSGAFTFNEGTDYQAKFLIMDASGNSSEETEWISFTKPVD